MGHLLEPQTPPEATADLLKGGKWPGSSVPAWRRSRADVENRRGRRRVAGWKSSERKKEKIIKHERIDAPHRSAWLKIQRLFLKQGHPSRRATRDNMILKMRICRAKSLPIPGDRNIKGTVTSAQGPNLSLLSALSSFAPFA